MWYCDKLLTAERIGMPIDPCTQFSHREFSNLFFVFFRTMKVRRRIAKTAISQLSIYIALRNYHKYTFYGIKPTIWSIFDVLIRSKFQSRLMGRIFARIEFKDTREEFAKEKLQLFRKLLIINYLSSFDSTKKKKEAANVNFFSIHSLNVMLVIFHWLS